ncbi:flavin-containing monooxygenase [Streptomyces chartreusis]
MTIITSADDTTPADVTHGPADAARTYDAVLPIDADTIFLKRAVNETELPPLLAALALVTGQYDQLLVDDLRPPLPPMDAVIAPQGGMTQEAQARAREVALDALVRFRDSGSRPAPIPDEDALHRIMAFLTRQAEPDCLPLLRHELGLPKDTGAPTWALQETAPGTDFTVAVIGAGISGMAAAHRLRQAGLSVVIFEKNTEVGGVWWENVYPGCRLDTPNFAYSYSFAQKQDWNWQFSARDDISGYLIDAATRFDLRRLVRFETEVVQAVFDDKQLCWSLTTQTRDGHCATHRFDAVVTAVGQLNRPNFPDVPGRDDFQGAAFHSAQWNSSINLTGKRVAVIGTGASAYQIVPAIADDVASLTVFQRHAPWMLPTPTYHDRISEGMSYLLRHVPYYGRWLRFWQFWLASEGRLPFVEADPDWSEPGSTSAGNAHLRKQLLERLEEQLADRPDLLKKMTPNYPPGLKRMTRDNGVWANALRKPHVDLVTDGITQITPTGIRTADGTHHDLDVIIYATGFQASDYLAPMTVKGRAGLDLHEHWNGDARAYKGVTVPGFPNLFMIMGPNTGVVVNGSAVFMAECAVEYTVATIGSLLRTGHRALDCRPDALDRFCTWVDAGNLRRTWGSSPIDSWYKNKFGRASQVWPYSLREYFELSRRSDLDDYELLGTLTPTARRPR